MIHLLRASHANEFELQNYKSIKDLRAITSKHPLTKITLPSTKLWSPTDLPNFPYRRQILNRLIGGEQWLVGLENLVNTGDVLHTAETYTPYTHQAVKLRRKGAIKKLICTCWETIPHNNEKFARLRKWKREAYQYVDLFHTPTERAKEALITEGVDPKKIVVIPYGVDLTRFKPVKRKANQRPLVLTVARLEKEKGMEDLEQVASLLPQYDFLVIGRGSYVPHGANITVSQVPYTQIHNIYQRADVFFLPSRSTATWEEQYGMALVEAMACALPIVTTYTGAIPEVVGKAGVLTDEGNIQAMVEAITNVTKTRVGLERARSRYDSRKIAKQLLTLY